MSSYFGLDLGASSIKVCKVSAISSGSFHIDGVGVAQNPVGTLDLSSSDVGKQLGDGVKGLLKEAGIRDRRVVVAVPESQVYSRIIEMPAMSEAELSSAVKWEAEQFVPVPIEEVEMDYTVVRRPLKGSTDNKMLVYLVASPKKHLQAMVDFLVNIGLEPIAVENEMLAVSRAYMSVSSDTGLVVVHLGALSSGISIVDNESLLFSYAVPTGGVAITRALSQSLSLPLSQAEEYKRTYGLDPSQFEGKIRQAILVVLNGILSEVRKAVDYYSTKNASKVGKIILSGGGAYMPDLITVMSEQFPGLEVLVGDPFGQSSVGRGVIIPQERAVFGVSVGLARRRF